MIEALLRGKLSREQENMEDVLTSNVFGMLQYVAPESGLFPFLAQATWGDDQCEFAEPRTVRSPLERFPGFDGCLRTRRPIYVDRDGFFPFRRTPIAE